MRNININLLVLPDDWLARAAAAKEAVRAGDNPDDHADVWRVLKHNLADLFPDEKCWYCETRCLRDDNAVDHFRPKGRVRDTTNPHSGYRWLAFEYRNFRYSCRYCNERRVNVKGETEGGKADRFPLLDESKRVYSEGPCEEEHPLLLDPCDPTDWRLLGCKLENGKPCSASQAATEKLRVEASIEIFHLHHEPTCKARHAEAIRFVQLIQEAKQLYLRIGTEQAGHQRFKQKAAEILSAMDRSTEYSGEKHFLLRAERDSEHPWIQDLLEA
ncbi:MULTISPECIES: hypothetical protein [unclassified Yoonia]|uniref:hypothetical protein n=1 Tax=unclassified Yoonia TaxID=2629118 RepID=UPI002AFE0DDB|nr:MULTISPECIES: hypothetical protein [unclassified Yoonia]